MGSWAHAVLLQTRDARVEEQEPTVERKTRRIIATRRVFHSHFGWLVLAAGRRHILHLANLLDSFSFGFASNLCVQQYWKFCSVF